jgi:RNA polymerase-binding transcription factor DksA
MATAKKPASSSPAAKKATSKATTKPTSAAAASKKAAAKTAPTRAAAAARSASGSSKAAAKAAPAKAAATKSTPAKQAASKSTAKATTAKKVAGTTKGAAANKAAPAPKAAAPKAKAVKGPGGLIRPSKEFDLKFLQAQQQLLLEERLALTGQALRLETEANSLIEDVEMGDVQFDDESGEGDTMVVERERDLALSAQAHQTVADIDAALARMAEGEYGYSLVSGRPIPKERLKAIPWAAVLVEEKVGGIGRR